VCLQTFSIEEILTSELVLIGAIQILDRVIDDLSQIRFLEDQAAHSTVKLALQPLYYHLANHHRRPHEDGGVVGKVLKSGQNGLVLVRYPQLDPCPHESIRVLPLLTCVLPRVLNERLE
jgi:hypothetical protein